MPHAPFPFPSPGPSSGSGSGSGCGSGSGSNSGSNSGSVRVRQLKGTEAEAPPLLCVLRKASSLAFSPPRLRSIRTLHHSQSTVVP